MKKLLSVTFILSIVLVSCSKSSTTNSSPTFTNSMTATVNGKSFVSTTTFYIKTTLYGPTDLNISGKADNGESIFLTIWDYKNATGSFTINPGSGIADGTYYPLISGTGFSANAGSVVITNIDKTSYSAGSVVTGTFSLSTYSGVSITNGNFSILIK